MSLLKKIKIGNFYTENNVFLAPLAGIGDKSYRILGKRFGAGLTFTEMVSAHGIVNGNQKTLDLLRLTKKERPSGIQIFGSNPEIMSSAVSICNEYPADLIDINGGCSVKKVLKAGSGAKILEEPEKFYDIVRACASASIYPISVMIRLGLTEDRINVVENAIAAEEAGSSLLILHARTAASKYRGKAKWDYIGLVKENLSIPVCGNGDIRTPEDAIKMITETGCDAVMVGRAAIGNPWLLNNIVNVFESYPNRAESEYPTGEEKIRLALTHLNMIISHKGEVRGIKEVKRILYRYLREIPDIAKFRESIFHIDSKDDAYKCLSSIL